MATCARGQTGGEQANETDPKPTKMKNCIAQAQSLS